MSDQNQTPDARAVPPAVLDATVDALWPRWRIDAPDGLPAAWRERAAKVAEAVLAAASPSLPDSGERAAEIVRECVETMLASTASFEAMGDALVERLASAGLLASSSSDGGEREARELLCQRCDREYAVWSAPNDLWNRVVRDHGGDGYGDGDAPWRDRFLCPSCFAKLAEERGIKVTPWVLVPASSLDDDTRARLAANPYEAASSSSPSDGEGDGHRFAAENDLNYCPRCGSAFDKRVGAGCNYCEHEARPVSVSPDGEGKRARLLLDAKDRWMHRALDAEARLAGEPSRVRELVTVAVGLLDAPEQTGEGRERTETAAYRDGWRTGVRELADVLTGEHPDHDPAGEGQDTPAGEGEPGQHAKLRRALVRLLRPVVPLERLGDTVEAVELAAVGYFAAAVPVQDKEGREEWRVVAADGTVRSGAHATAESVGHPGEWDDDFLGGPHRLQRRWLNATDWVDAPAPASTGGNDDGC